MSTRRQSSIAVIKKKGKVIPYRYLVKSYPFRFTRYVHRSTKWPSGACYGTWIHATLEDKECAKKLASIKKICRSSKLKLIYRTTLQKSKALRRLSEETLQSLVY